MIFNTHNTLIILAVREVLSAGKEMARSYVGEKAGESEWSGRLAKRQLEQAGARACNSYWLCCCARCPFASCAAALVAAGVACIK